MEERVGVEKGDGRRWKKLPGLRVTEVGGPSPLSKQSVSSHDQCLSEAMKASDRTRRRFTSTIQLD